MEGVILVVGIGVASALRVTADGVGSVDGADSTLLTGSDVATACVDCA